MAGHSLQEIRCSGFQRSGLRQDSPNGVLSEKPLFVAFSVRDVAGEAPRIDELVVVPPYTRTDQHVPNAGVFAANPGFVIAQRFPVLEMTKYVRCGRGVGVELRDVMAEIVFSRIAE